MAKNKNLSNKSTNPINIQTAQNPFEHIKTQEDAVQYYLEHFEKWAKWQEESPEKLPESCRYYDFTTVIEILKELKNLIVKVRKPYTIIRHKGLPHESQNVFYGRIDFDRNSYPQSLAYEKYLDFITKTCVEIVEYNSEYKCFFLANCLNKEITISKVKISKKYYCSNKTIFKECIFENQSLIAQKGQRVNLKKYQNLNPLYKLHFIKCSGFLSVKQINMYGLFESIQILIDDCNYERVSLFGVNISVENFFIREYLTNLYKEKKLELINCNFPELDKIKTEEENQRLKNELAILEEKIKSGPLVSIQQPTWKRDIVFENGSYRFKFDVAQYMVFFEEYLSLKYPNTRVSVISTNFGLEIQIFSQELDANELENLYTEYINFYENPDTIQKIIDEFENNPQRYRQGLMTGMLTKLVKLQYEVKRMIREVDDLAESNTIYKSEREKLKLELNQALRGSNIKIENPIEIIPVLENMQLEIEKMKQPIIYTEGQTDVKYLQTCQKIFAEQYPNFAKVDIKVIGNEQKNEGNGYKNLDNTFKSYKNHTNKLHHKLVLLYDCDVNCNDENVDEKLYKIKIQPNPNNQIYKKGIENLLPEKYFEDSSPFVTVSEPTFESVGKKDVNKTNLCDYICGEENLEDFEYFHDLLAKLDEIFR